MLRRFYRPEISPCILFVRFANLRWLKPRPVYPAREITILIVQKKVILTCCQCIIKTPARPAMPDYNCKAVGSF